MHRDVGSSDISAASAAPFSPDDAKLAVRACHLGAANNRLTAAVARFAARVIGADGATLSSMIRSWSSHPTSLRFLLIVLRLSNQFLHDPLSSLKTIRT